MAGDLMIILCLSLIFIISVWTIWLRYFYFFRAASYPESFKEGIVFSPAEGIVAYNKPLQKRKDILICKSDDFNGKRLFKIEQFLKEENYYQVGIFMTKYDNHHVCSSLQSKIQRIVCIGRNNDSPMMKFTDEFLSIFGISFFNWINRAESYIHYNQQYVIEYENGVLVVITMDKYVNKFDFEIKNDSENPYELGFVHRGSQTDIFIPESVYKSTEVVVGKRLSYKDIVFKLKESK